mmetsp:Transcript_954/g.4016  ORF Transcript_954/g.4016 Transcript_954/m.4016 type:complete len:235 (-) Transcript_954:1975-2679(-)
MLDLRHSREGDVALHLLEVPGTNDTGCLPRCRRALPGSCRLLLADPVLEPRRSPQLHGRADVLLQRALLAEERLCATPVLRSGERRRSWQFLHRVLALEGKVVRVSGEVHQRPRGREMRWQTGVALQRVTPAVPHERLVVRAEVLLRGFLREGLRSKVFRHCQEGDLAQRVADDELGAVGSPAPVVVRAQLAHRQRLVGVILLPDVVVVASDGFPRLDVPHRQLPVVAGRQKDA